MRIARFSHNGRTGYGIIEGSTIRRLKASPFARGGSSHALHADSDALKLNKVRLLAPCTPSKIVCLGLNYRSHAEEFKLTIPAEPLIFMKPSTSVIGPGEDIVIPEGAGRVDYEGEMAVIIGKKAKNIPESKAFNYILGCTCLNDVSERHNQKVDGQWTRAKGYDTFAPIGPWIETGIDPSNLKLETHLNGACRQSTRTSDLIFDVPRLVSFISGVMTLLPGDVIATGTTSGVGAIKPGDIVEITIEKIGTLRNPVIQA